MRSRLENAMVTGYAVDPGLIVEGSWGIGAAVCDQHRRPAWALSLTGDETRFRPPRVAEMGILQLEQAQELALRLR